VGRSMLTLRIAARRDGRTSNHGARCVAGGRGGVDVNVDFDVDMAVGECGSIYAARREGRTSNHCTRCGFWCGCGYVNLGGCVGVNLFSRPTALYGVCNKTRIYIIYHYTLQGVLHSRQITEPGQFVITPYGPVFFLLQRIFCCNVYSVATCILLQRVFCCNVYSAATYILLQRIFCRNVYSVATYILLQRIFCCNVYILLQRIFCCNDYSETLQVVLHSLSVELYILSVELYILSVELYILTPYKSLCTQLLNSLGTATLLH